MSDNRLVLGIYLEPNVWITTKQGEIIEHETIEPTDCLEIILHRVLPNGIEVCVQRQGFVVVAFPEDVMSIHISDLNYGNLLPSNAARFSVDFFNSFCFSLYDQMHRNGISSTIKPAVSLADIWRWRTRPDVELAIIAQEQPMPILNQHTWLPFDVQVSNAKKTIGVLSDNDKLFRPSLTVSLLDNALNVMFVDSDFTANWQLIALLNKAVLSTHRGEFAEAHILSWAVIEKIIQNEWDRFIESTNEILDDGAKTVNSKRKEILNNRDYTVSVRTEMLELAKIIPYTLYKRLSPIRKTRNDWMHNLGPVSLQDCRECYEVAREFLSRKLGYEFQHPGGYYLFDEHFQKID